MPEGLERMFCSEIWLQGEIGFDRERAKCIECVANTVPVSEREIHGPAFFSPDQSGNRVGGYTLTQLFPASKSHNARPLLHLPCSPTQRVALEPSPSPPFSNVYPECHLQDAACQLATAEAVGS